MLIGGQETFIIIDFENNFAALFWGGGGGLLHFHYTFMNRKHFNLNF